MRILRLFVISATWLVANASIYAGINILYASPTTGTDSGIGAPTSTTSESQIPDRLSFAISRCKAAQLKPQNDLNEKGPSYCLGVLYESIGKSQDALEAYQQAVEHCPDNRKAWRRIAVLCEELGQQQQATEALKKVLRLEAVKAESGDHVGNAANDGAVLRLRLAHLLMRTGDKDGPEEAIRVCDEALQEVVLMDIEMTQDARKDGIPTSTSDTKEPPKLEQQQQKSREEMMLMKRKTLAMLCTCKGLALYRLGRFQAASQAHDMAVTYSSTDLETINLAAVAAEKAGDANKAEAYFLRAIDLSADELQMSAAAAAAAAAAPATTVGTDTKRDIPIELANIYTNYGVFLKSQNRLGEAVQALERAIALDPQQLMSETGHAVVQLASLQGGSADIRSMSDDYVVGLFNGFAEKFDKNLVEDLGYKGHILVINEVLKCIQEQQQQMVAQDGGDRSNGNDGRVRTVLKVLDIGCGTGLCGQRLVNERFKIVKREDIQNIPPLYLIGVDLSKRMLHKASERKYSGVTGETPVDSVDVSREQFINDQGDNDDAPLRVYQELHLQNCVEYLANSCDDVSLDYVVAADVLIYIGDLDALFAQISRVLVRTRGYFVFTIEEWAGPSTPSSSSSSSAAFTSDSSQQTGGVNSDKGDGKVIHTDADADADADNEDREDEEENGVFLLPSGRFGHKPAYIYRLAKRYALSVERENRQYIRTQGGKPVASRTFTLRRT